MTDPLSDGELVRRFCEGDRTAFDKIDNRHRQRLIRFASKQFPALDAEELAQGTLVRALESLRTIRQPKTLALWLDRTLFRLGIDTLRRKTSATFYSLSENSQPDSDSEVSLDWPDPAAETPDQIVERRDWARSVWQIAEQILTPSEFETLWLRYSEDATDREIARWTDRPPGTIRVELHRARKKILEYLNDSTKER